MEEYNLKQTIDNLRGPSKEQIMVHNQWASVAFDRYHKDSKVEIEFIIEGISRKGLLCWDSNFPKAAMRENKDIANHGAVAMAWFVMAVLLSYRYVEQTEINTGVDYRFIRSEPDDDDLNFLDDYHYVEVSGLSQESKTNTLKERIRQKHEQIKRGTKRNEPSSVIVTLFHDPKTVKETHK